MSDPAPNSASRPRLLVSTEWAIEYLNDPKVRFIEVDVDTAAYSKGHLPGAIGWNWQTDLNDGIRRDIVDPAAFAELNRAAGIQAGDTIVLYGDNNNWFAAWALWQYKYYGHADVRLIDGGRKKWEAEGRPTTVDLPPARPRSDYPTPVPDESVRAYRRDVEQFLGLRNAVNLIDVRSPDEFSGKINAPPGLAETAQRSGHIPGARNVPWAKATREDGTFKSPAQLSHTLHHRRRAGSFKADDRLLPHRRALQPHVVCAQISARFSGRPQL